MKKLLTLFLLVAMAATSLKATPILPQKGTYDCTVGNDKIILIAEEVSPEMVKGFFVPNEGKAAENTHSFMMTAKGSKWVIQSDLYSGSIKGTGNDNGFSGQISYFNKPKKLLFFYQKGNVTINRRINEAVQPSDRYRKEIFSNVDVTKDIRYGRALGYWTHNPYNNEPYVEVISKGINNTLIDPDSLDLKMDIYQPTGDTMSKRPLVLLIHGGAFYIGTKQCPTMKILATTLAKRGYVVACIDYRMGFKLRASDIERSGYRAVQDAHAALRFLSHFAPKYKIDPDWVYVGGTSAGAIATLNLAFMDNNERPESVQSRKPSEDMGKIESSGNQYTDKFHLRGVANMWGAVTDINIIDKNDQIPVLSIHGTADDIVPYDYNYPFQSALLINRLLMNKMYGSKSVTDRLNSFGIKNKLVSFEGLKHEPQTDKFDHINYLMDTISNNVTRFYYELTTPEVVVPEKQLTITPGSPIVPIYTEINNGEFAGLEVVGGVKTSDDPNNLSIIWFKNNNSHQFTLMAKNQYNAWSVKTCPIKINGN
ncbi:MAG TPA: alpha/beta hydrolase [Prolixibacteraceae bacterium]|nr:alpha/beta hydrolase [Prolixibacteraceae bacterium]HPS12843.1 alpha/beta hydrolase [Prolixibacteraceae bacterium]